MFHMTLNLVSRAKKQIDADVCQGCWSGNEHCPWIPNFFIGVLEFAHFYVSGMEAKEDQDFHSSRCLHVHDSEGRQFWCPSVRNLQPGVHASKITTLKTINHGYRSQLKSKDVEVIQISSMLMKA